MADMIKWLWSMVFGVAMLACVAGCDGSGGKDTGVTFKNDAAVSVTVSPNGQAGWLEFVVDPGQERTVDVGGTVYFLYAPSSRVWADSSEDGEIVFYDR